MSFLTLMMQKQNYSIWIILPEVAQWIQELCNNFPMYGWLQNVPNYSGPFYDVVLPSQVLRNRYTLRPSDQCACKKQIESKVWKYQHWALIHSTFYECKLWISFHCIKLFHWVFKTIILNIFIYTTWGKSHVLSLLRTLF